ncbi:MAG: GEVED domain-containing protein, partial [Flavipsychrobacter sp.]|nr:GEVED domain-containing protein [Flavipsychrobacter sp.]
MKRLFTLSTALKVFVMLVLLGSVGNKALAQAANCTIQSYDYYFGYYEQNLHYYGAQDITIGTTTPMYTFPDFYPSPSNTAVSTIDLTGSVSFAVNAGTTAPVSTDLYSYAFLGMYVDWNKDGNFSTIPNTTSNPYGEFISGVQFNNPNYNPTSPYTVSLTNGNLYVPGGVASGNYRCRIIYGYNGSSTMPPALSQYPCGNWTSGTIYNLGAPYGECASVDVILNVTNTASCFPPQPPTLTSVTAGAATIGWNAPSTITNNYQWVLVPSGGTATTTPIASGTTTGTSTTISSLSPITSYSFYVRANCSATDSSSWAGPLTFTTLAPQCTATPNTPSISNSPLTTGVCAAQTLTINATNVNTQFSGITYQWKKATTTTSTPPAQSAYSNISGATGLSYTPPLFPVNFGNNNYTWYEVTPTCNLPPSTTYTAAASAPYPVTVLSYGIPYYQDFSTTATGAIPQCFENDPADPLGSFKVQQSFTTADGTPFPSIVAAFPTLPPSAKNAFFTIPPLALTANTTYTIQFNYGRSNITYPQRIQLYANTADPGTLNTPGASFVTSATGSTKLFDTSYTFNNVGFEKLTFTPTASGTYFFSWYDSTKETSAPANGTAQGIGNIAIYIASPCVRPTAQPTALNFTSNVSTITGSFTPPTTTPDKYLVVRTLGTTPLSGFTPSDGAYYSINQAAGNGTVVYVGKYPTYTDLYLSSG